jgi:uncharacterized protein YbbC (DUF1343 family)
VSAVVRLLPALALAACVSACTAREPPGPGTAPHPRTGLDVLQAEGFTRLRGKRVGVITNPTGSDRSLRSLPDLLAGADGVKLAAIFGPEHGAAGAAAAGDAVGHAVDPRTGVPVHSLYGSVRRPTRAMLEGIDLLLFDIQDVGVRTYTYLATLAEALAASAEAGIPLWVLDRPVPLFGDIVEGPVLEPGRESFVGPHRVPLRHGLTPGEFARMVNEERRLGAQLEVVALEGWRRDVPYEAFGLVWIGPSPNIPTLDTAFVYAGMVLLEGTNLSEGRGTARPFHLAGAPWVDADRVADELRGLDLPGCAFRAARFVPTASKHAGVECAGIDLHVTDRRAFRPVAAAVALLLAVKRAHPDRLEIRRDTFDRLAGTAALREAIEAGASLEEITARWTTSLEEYARRRARFLLYP